MDYRKANVKQVVDILREMTVTKRPPLKKNAFEKRMDQILNWLVSNAVLTFVVMLILAVCSYFFRSDAILNTTLTFGLLSAFFGWMLQAAVIVALVPSILEIRKDPYKNFFCLVERASNDDSGFLDKLKKCDTLILRYVLAQYKLERVAFEKRGNLLSGSIEKIGFFPALAALIVLSVSLTKATFLHDWSNGIVLLLFSFYIMNVAAFAMHQKMDAVIALAEHYLETSDTDS